MKAAKFVRYFLSGILLIISLNSINSQTTHYNFTYSSRSSLLSDGWDFIAVSSTGGSRNTEQTSGAVVSYDQVTHPGVIRIPTDAGDLWAWLNNTRNSLFRSLPSGWTSIRLKLRSFAPTQDYQQAGLVVYQNDNNYVQIMRIHEGVNSITMAREVNGNAENVHSVSVSATSNLHFRLDRNTTSGLITSYYSLNGTDWVQVGSVTQTINNPRFGIIVGASPGGYPNVDVEWAEIITEEDGSLTPGTIGSPQTICNNTAPSPLIQLNPATGGSGTYTYQWQRSADNNNWTDISGATETGFTPPVLTSSTYYRRRVSSGSYTPVVSSPVLITVSPVMTQAQLHDDVTTGNNTAAVFNVSITGGTPPYTVNYTRNGVAQSAVTNYTSGSGISTGILTTGTYTYVLTSVTDAGGCTAQNLGTGITITVSESGGGGGGPTRYNFTYSSRSSLLSDGWDFIAVSSTGGSRNTEQTSGAVVSYDQVTHPGVIRIPTDAGDLWAWLNNTRNSLFRSLPSGWTSIRLKLRSFAPTQDYQQAGLVVYQNDNNYVQIMRIHEGVNSITMAREVNGNAENVHSVSVSATSNLHFRLDRNTTSGLITSYYSLNGTDWVQVGSVTQTINNPRFGIIVGASPGGYPNVDVEWAEIITEEDGSLTPGTIGSPQTICNNTAPSPLIQLNPATGGSGTYTYQWQRSADNNNWTDISGATETGFTPPVLTSSTYYRRRVSSGSYTPVVSSPVLITVSPVMTQAQLHDDVTTGNNTAAVFNVSITGGTPPYTVNYTRNGVAQSAVTNYTSGSGISTGILTTGTYTYVLTSVTDAGGCTAQNLGTGITVTVLNYNPVDNNLQASPVTLVFNGIRGQSISETRDIFVYTSEDNSVGWTLTSNVSWLVPSVSEGITEGLFDVRVNTTGLTEGLHNGTITIVSTDGSANPVTIPVTLIINPDVPVKATAWKDGRDAAMSISVDDGEGSGFEALYANGVGGTYVCNGTTPPSFYNSYYNAGMELGSHLATHPCYILTDDLLRTREIIPNIEGICNYTAQPCSDLISLVWPCGTTSYREQAVAADYFLSARGYNKNQLEDATPRNFMDLNSYNSHESFPYPPSDFKMVVNMALDQHKWFNLVLHSMSNDDGAIDYASTLNMWIASIGDVIKYIMQRDRMILTNYNAMANSIAFNVSRLAITSTSYRNFETAFGNDDITTLQIDIDDSRTVDNVLVGGIANPFVMRNINGNQVLLTNVRLDPSLNKMVEVIFEGESTPRIYLNRTTIGFSTTSGINPPDQYLSVTSNMPELLNWTAAVDNVQPSWLSINPQSGSGNGSIAIIVNNSDLATGTYSKNITISSPGASNSPQTVNVILTVNQEGTLHYDFNYSDRASLLSAGWDFIARTSSGGSRNTEQTSGAVVSFDQSLHPGVIRIPADEGDLWSNLNNTRNSLFRDLPSGWTSVRLKLASFAPSRNYQQAGLVVYQNDDNYVQITRIFEGDNRFTFATETQANAAVLNSILNNSTTNLHFRLDRDPVTNAINSFFSLNGTDWTQLGAVTQQFSNPRLGIIVGASPGGFPVADIEWVEIISDNSKSGQEAQSSNLPGNEISEYRISSVHKLYQNYPNPFSEFTWIEYHIAEDSRITLELHNSYGRKLETIVDEFMRAGNYRFVWEASGYPSGMYILTLKGANFASQIKIIKLK